MTHPQGTKTPLELVDERAGSSTPWGRPTEDPTWENAAFSTIHSRYYCYSSYLIPSKKS